MLCSVCVCVEVGVCVIVVLYDFNLVVGYVDCIVLLE